MTSFSSIIYIFLVGFISLHSTFGLSLPKRALGYVYKESMSRNAPITLSFYIDNTCPDSQVAYPTMIALVDHFGAQNLKLITHQFPLPYHRNSHTIAKGAHVIDAFSNGTATYPYIKIVFDNISQLTTSATIKCNDEQVLDILAPLAQKVSGISSSQFKQQVAETSFDQQTRLGWKYSCTRGVYGTPTFMVNDVVVEADPTWSVDQWVKIIQPLLRN